jgi:5-bromo-4-chloroindolyl phosphate hydrolysis protein
MRNDNYIDFGEEIGRTVRHVLNSRDFYDLRNTINNAMRNIPGMGGGPFGGPFNGPYGVGGFPRLSKDDGGGAGQGYGRSQVGRQYPRKSKGASFVPSTLFMVFGFIGAGVFGVPALVGIVLENTVGGIPAMEAVSQVFGVLFFVSLILAFRGICLRKRTKRFRLYLNVLNGRTYCTVRELAAAGGYSAKFIVKDLRKMIRAGLFEEGYLDDQKTCLMTDYETYNQYLETMKNAKERQEDEKREQEKWVGREGGSELKTAIDEGKNYIRAIKEANDALPEAEISEKLDQLEQVTGEIFRYVEQHPEKLPEIRKFMSYYMPITLKLVNAYQRYDRLGSDTSETESAKLEIKGTLGTINKAYRNLLKKLMQTDILDVSTDISALQTILAQEGLTEDDFTAGSAKPGKPN